MANTTNFGWETPDDTDLVKDGAAAMRTLGNAIDTSLVDLKGGTTGQVLSKTSNTDMDFTWVALDDSNAIQNAIVDAKGDLISATAADTPARLAVGTDGQILSADSSTSTGLKWIPAGKVLQVVNATYTTAVTIASATYADTGLSATITPILSTSKILVIFNQTFEMYRSSTYQGVGIKLFRGATQIFDAEGAYITGAGSIEAGGATAVRNSQVTSYSYLDSPSTTSATTYKTQGRVRETANSGGVVFQNGDSKSLITLIEVAA